MTILGQLNDPAPSLAVAARVRPAVAAAFLAELGGGDSITVEDLADIPQSAIDDVTNVLVVEGTLASALDKGSLVRWRRLAERIQRHHLQMAGLVPPGTQMPQVPPALQVQKKMKFSEFLDQSDDGAFEPLASQRIRQARANLEDVTGGPGPMSERPSDDQLSALAAKVTEMAKAYTDFAVFGPFNQRAQKLRKFEAQAFVNGAWVARQLQAPCDFAAWRSCWRVFRAAMIAIWVCQTC